MQQPEMTVLITGLRKCVKGGNITASPSIFFTENSEGLKRGCADLIIVRRFNNSIGTRSFQRNEASSNGRHVWKWYPIQKKLIAVPYESFFGA